MPRNLSGRCRSGERRARKLQKPRASATGVPGSCVITEPRFVCFGISEMCTGYCTKRDEISGTNRIASRNLAQVRPELFTVGRPNGRITMP